MLPIEQFLKFSVDYIFFIQVAGVSFESILAQWDMGLWENF
jgi:hypothetical protein